MFDSLSRLRYSIQQTFSILRPIMKDPLGGQDVTDKDPDAIGVLGTGAAAFLFLDGSAVFVLHARGGG